MADKIATREAYGKALAEFGGDERIVVLDSDLSKSTKTDIFFKKYPERFFNMGIAEGNMMGVAAGLAATGKIVFASSFAVFAALRACEQVRNSIAYPRLNVKIGASHAGLTVGEDGASHQSIEDIAVMRAIPNMTVINPSDAVTMRLAVKAAIEMEGPVYLRLGRLPVPVVYDNVDFTVGKGIQLTDGSDVTVIATGSMLSISQEAVSILKEQGISARLIDIHTIKPIDEEMILKAASETGAIVTVEEHNIIGGLGGAVAEAVSQAMPVPVKRVGVKDMFGKSGKPYELLDQYGLNTKAVVEAAKQAISMKK